MTYYDPNTESYQTIPTTRLIDSQNGWTREVEYGVLFELPRTCRAKYLSAVRHKDRGDLATEIRLHNRRPAMRSDEYVGGRAIPRSEEGKPLISQF